MSGRRGVEVRCGHFEVRLGLWGRRVVEIQGGSGFGVIEIWWSGF